jgi:MOSC domain-containing protein YiiM
LDVYGPGIKEEIYDACVKAGDATSPRWGMSGFYARVVEPGPVHPGDAVMLLSALC